MPVHPIPLTVGGVQTSMSEQQVFGSAQTVLPLKVRIFPYDSPLPVDGMSTDDATYAVNERGADNGLIGSDTRSACSSTGLPASAGRPSAAAICMTPSGRSRSCETTAR